MARKTKPRCTPEEYARNTAAMRLRVAEEQAILDVIKTKLRELLAVEPASEGQLVWRLREHATEFVRSALASMVGSRKGAETTGEVVVAGWDALGSECYGMRGQHPDPRR